MISDLCVSPAVPRAQIRSFLARVVPALELDLHSVATLLPFTPDFLPMHALPEVDDSVRVSQRCGRGPPFSLEKTMAKVATTSSPGLATFVAESPTTQTLDQVATYRMHK